MKDKKKPAMALVISVGPKMPKKPTDTATPDKMKKYGSMKKGSPVPNWAQQNNSNRSNFKGTEDYQQQTGGDAYASTYGGKPVGIQRMPSGNPKDMLNVKDLATGTYGGQEYGGQEPGYYAGNPNLTNKKINAFTAAEEAKKKPQPQPQPQPTIAPPVGQAFNTYQQQPQQVQTGEPMNLAFRLLKESIDRMEVAGCKNCEGTGKIPFRASQARGKFDPNPEAGKIGDPCPSCGGSGSAPISDPAFAAMQQKLTGEPMNLAFRLLKEVPMYNYGGSPIPERIPEWLKTAQRLKAEREEKTGVLPLWELRAAMDDEERREKQRNKLAEMRAARDAARAQMGQQNPDRGGDVDPI